MIVWSQKHRQEMSLGDFLRFLEDLAQEENPFAAVVRYAKPRRAVAAM